jgi:lipoprotein-releasing system permease protein
VVNTGFQSFVAWRYLMARPMRVSRPITALIIATALTSLFGLGLGFGLEAWWLDHETRPPYSPLVGSLSNLHEYDGYGVWALRGGGLLFLVVGIVLARLRGPWTRTVGWALIVAGVQSAVAGLVAAQLIAQVTFVEWVKWWGLVSLAPLVLLLPLFLFRFFFTFFTTVSMAGVFVGSMALVVVLSVMSGFETDLRDKILGSSAHIRVTRDEGMMIDWRDVMARVRQVPGVTAVTPYATTEVVLSANSNYATVVIKGIDPETVGDVTELVKDIEGDDVADQAAMQRLYPLRDDDLRHEVDAPAGGPPPGPVIDPAPDDMLEGGDPLDYSGDNDPLDLGGDDDEPDATDRAPADFVGGDADDDPLDLSGDGDAFEDDDDLDLGGDPMIDRERPVLELDRDHGRLDLLDGVLVGKELVKQLHLYEGQEVRLVSPLADPANPDATGTPIPFHRDYRIAGTFYTGMYEYDLKFVYVPLESLQEFLQLGDEVDGIEVRTNDPDGTGSIRDEIARRLGPGYAVQDWKELNRNLFSALKLEKIAMFLVLAIIILVASFSIVGNLIMVVVEKQKEIATLKTLGASDLGVMRVFVMQGFFIGLVGTMVGIAEGLVICLLCMIFGFPINPDVYYIKTLPIHVDPVSVAAIGAAGLVISAVATLYPAQIAARLRPAIGLRHD